MTADWIAAQDAGSVVVVVLVVAVVVVVVLAVVEVVRGRNVQSVSAQCVSPVSTVRVRVPLLVQVAVRRARQTRCPEETTSSQQMTVSGRPHVVWRSWFLQRRRSVPPAIALWIAARTHFR